MGTGEERRGLVRAITSGQKGIPGNNCTTCLFGFATVEFMRRRNLDVEFKTIANPERWAQATVSLSDGAWSPHGSKWVASSESGGFFVSSVKFPKFIKWEYYMKEGITLLIFLTFTGPT